MSANRPEVRPTSLQCVWVSAPDGRLESHWVADSPGAAADVIQFAAEFRRLAMSLEAEYGHSGLRRTG